MIGNANRRFLHCTVFSLSSNLRLFFLYSHLLWNVVSATEYIELFFFISLCDCIIWRGICRCYLIVSDVGYFRNGICDVFCCCFLLMTISHQTYIPKLIYLSNVELSKSVLATQMKCCWISDQTVWNVLIPKPAERSVSSEPTNRKIGANEKRFQANNVAKIDCITNIELYNKKKECVKCIHHKAFSGLISE